MACRTYSQQSCNTYERRGFGIACGACCTLNSKFCTLTVILHWQETSLESSAQIGKLLVAIPLCDAGEAHCDQQFYRRISYMTSSGLSAQLSQQDLSGRGRRISKGDACVRFLSKWPELTRFESRSATQSFHAYWAPCTAQNCWLRQNIRSCICSEAQQRRRKTDCQKCHARLRVTATSINELLHLKESALSDCQFGSNITSKHRWWNCLLSRPWCCCSVEPFGNVSILMRLTIKSFWRLRSSTLCRCFQVKCDLSSL